MAVTAAFVAVVSFVTPLLEPRVKHGGAVRTRMALGEELPESDTQALFASLRKRQAQLDDAQTQLDGRWRRAECTSAIKLVLDNWVRRLDLDWPLAVLGTAQGGLYVADVARGETIAKAVGAHPAAADGTEGDMRLLYGDFDGGGLTAVSLRGDLIVSAGREGGAKLWRLSRTEDERPLMLIPAGELTASGVVSSSLIDEARSEVWTASLDGTLRRFEVSPTAAASACVRTIRAASPLLCVAACEERSLVACGDSAGIVRLFTAAGEPCGTWSPLAFDGSRAFKGSMARSIGFVRAGEQCCVVVGGADGSLHYRWLANGGGTDAFDASRQPQELLPSHQGAVVALQGRGTSGLLISGARDGTMRVWDLASAAEGEAPKCLYGLGGYKVWLGSICTDGRRLVSDGSDNTVVVHDFGGEPDS